MSFGGGGSGGSSTVAAHTHNSGLSGDGGALSGTLTQMDATLLLPYMNSNFGKWNAGNTNTFRTSVIAGVPAGPITEYP